MKVSRKLFEILSSVFAAIVEDARYPQKYRMLVSAVDVVFADVAQPDQARLVALNAKYFLKNEGHLVISIKASCIDSTAEPEAVFASQVTILRENSIKPIEQVTLEPYERDHAMVTGESGLILPRQILNRPAAIYNRHGTL